MSTVEVSRLFLESRYRKLVRGLPQTVFYCPVCKGGFRRRRDCAKCQGAGKLTEDSVQELLGGALLPAFRARQGYFHGAGREDIDVRMLGRGRPFVYELVGIESPDVDLAAVRQQIHERHGARIEIDPLVPVPKGRVKFWKESHFAKVYRALVVTEAAFDASRCRELLGRELKILQRTPRRVAHRRADLSREREVAVQAMSVVDAHGVRLDLRCAHGTYVKEWISGDEGRTSPALADLLGVACKCAELDVLEILTDEPPA